MEKGLTNRERCSIICIDRGGYMEEKEINMSKIRCPRTGVINQKTGKVYHAVEDGQHVVKHGNGNTIKYGIRKRFKCQICAHTFYDDSVKGDKQE